ncbi:hypothetical protein [Rodentibacter caecimuris]|nr:hypothetical protein [Rodentibacter heylii]AOF54339.1 hypothetical protein AC062_2253 [Pasteurellaceae bacterium NI1060]MCX2960188.1 hypothetical protein [Rodentibacter heylii]
MRLKLTALFAFYEIMSQWHKTDILMPLRLYLIKNFNRLSCVFAT